MVKKRRGRIKKDIRRNKSILRERKNTIIGDRKI